MGDRSWRNLLDHDGIVVIELTLISTAEGGLTRELSSGYKADWTWPTLPSPDGPHRLVRAPIEGFVGEHRSIRPGDSGTVHVRPYDPDLWSVLPNGATVDLCRLARSATSGFVVGHGTILSMRNVPDHPVPLLVADRPLRRGEAALRHVESGRGSGDPPSQA